MSSNFYTTKTAALKATKADIRNFNAQEIKLKDKNILDYIKDSEFDSYDARDPQLKNDELDIWNTAISLSEEGHIEVKSLEHSVLGDLNTNKITLEGITESQCNTLKTAVKVIDNEVLGENDEHIMYWQTDGLTAGDGMFVGCSSLTTFNSDLSSLTSGLMMFISCTSLTTFNSDLSSLIGDWGMFNNCTNLASFNASLSSLTSCLSMFAGCTSLTTFNSDLSSLTEGAGMFSSCTNLTSFTSDLPSLTNGTQMFESCTALTSFSSDLSSLTNGKSMFTDCDNLTSFNANLSSLTDGRYMFGSCKLDAPSVANIVHTLPTHETGGEIAIGIGYDNTEADALLFLQDCDCETAQEFLDEFSAKNWTVRLYCNGRPTTTYGMRRGETLPVYAKLEEVIMPTNENELKPHYAYTSQDGSKFYNINCFHSTNGSTEGYDIFSSLEEAISTYNVTPKN